MLLSLKRLKIKSIINGTQAITTDDGTILFNKVVEGIKSGYIIELDFTGITIMTATFLNSSIGRLYIYLKIDEPDNYYRLVNIKKDYKILVKKVIERSKEFTSNPKVFEDIANYVIYGS